MYSSRLYAKNHVFEIVEESVKVYHLHMYNENIQQNSLICVESCVTEEFHMSPRFSPAFFIAMQCVARHLL